jgi:hypothetical protein
MSMSFFQRIKSTPWLATGFSILGALLYASQAWAYIHSQMSIDDEGNYIYKGLLFVRGQYEIYQDYGPWPNHMPLSFIIPGTILDWFGPSLRTARFLAFGLSLFLLLGIWIIARRWGAGWWPAFAVWTMALNPAIIKIYSLMTSQVIIACMLAWVLVFVFAERRSVWQIILGSALAGAMLLTRLNLAPLLPLLVLYIYWQHGKRPAICGSIAMLTVVIIGHAIFWPGILRMWATWIPAGLAPFLQAYRAPDAIAFWNPQADLEARLISVFWGLRFHFVATVGVLSTLLLWPRESAWKSDSQRRASFFLAVLFVSLFLLHAYVTVGTGIASNKAYSTSYCTFCLPTYMGFFSFTGILLIVISASSWRYQLPIWLQGFIGLLILGITTGIGYASFGTLGDGMATWQFPVFTHRWLRHNTLRVWKFLNYHYAISYHQSKRILPTVAGSLTGIVVLLISGGLTAWNRLIKIEKNKSFGYLAMVTLLVVGWLLAPTQALGGGYQSYDCNSDILATYDILGAELKEMLPAGSTLYWQGEPASTVLIYLSDVGIFPAQLNQKFTFFDGDTEALERYGFWNQELAERWLAEADVALVGTLYYGNLPKEDIPPEIKVSDFYNVHWLVEGLAPDSGYQLIDQVHLPMPCQPNQTIQVFQRQSK